MDGPLAFVSQRRGAAGGGLVALRIVEVAERPVDGADAVGAAGDHHALQGRVPLIARIIRIEAADDDGARPAGSGKIGNAEMQRLETPARLRDGLDVGHAERDLDEALDADGLLDLSGFL